jgi:hypothetical protein
MKRIGARIGAVALVLSTGCQARLGTRPLVPQGDRKAVARAVPRPPPPDLIDRKNELEAELARVHALLLGKPATTRRSWNEGSPCCSPCATSTTS